MRRSLRALRGLWPAAAGDGDGGLSDLGLASRGVVDRLPGVVVDGIDGVFDVGVLGDCDRPGRVVAVESVDHVIGEEPRVGAHCDLQVDAPRGAPDPADGLHHEAPVAALGLPSRIRVCTISPVSERTATSG